MAESTRLRFIAANNVATIAALVDQLPFKVEIKGNPVRDKSGWVVFFVVPDNKTFNNMDVRK